MAWKPTRTSSTFSACWPTGEAIPQLLTCLEELGNGAATIFFQLKVAEDIEVQLCTTDTKPVASVRSSNMGFYLLPLRDAPWDVYPVAAEVRVMLDGKVLGKPLQIECSGMNGLYPDDVYDVMLE